MLIISKKSKPNHILWDFDYSVECDASVCFFFCIQSNADDFV